MSVMSPASSPDTSQDETYLAHLLQDFRLSHESDLRAELVERDHRSRTIFLRVRRRSFTELGVSVNGHPQVAEDDA